VKAARQSFECSAYEREKFPAPATGCGPCYTSDLSTMPTLSAPDKRVKLCDM
jgi:hypothetical protein